MSNPTLIKNYVAEAAITARRIVKTGATDYAVLMAAAATDAIIGVADELGQATVNGRVDIVQAGIADVEFGGTVARGALVTADATGKAVAAAPAAGANNRVLGIALVSAVSGDIAPVLINLGTTQG